MVVRGSCIEPRRVLVELLVRRGSWSLREIAKSVRLPQSLLEDLLRELSEKGLVEVLGETISVRDRLGLAIHLLELGVPPSRAAECFGWRNFEVFVAEILARSGFSSRRGVRISVMGRRAEIDIIAYNSTYALSVDCKRWKRGLPPSSVRNIVARHVERTRLLVEALRLGLIRIPVSRVMSVLPVIVSLRESRMITYEGVPIVPVDKLPWFLANLTPTIVDLALLTFRV